MAALMAEHRAGREQSRPVIFFSLFIPLQM